MKEIYKNIILSFKKGDEGFSARKMTAFVIILMVCIGNGLYLYNCYEKNSWSNINNWNFIMFCASAFYLGLVTIEQIIEIRSGKTISSKSESTTIVTEEKKEIN